MPKRRPVEGQRPLINRYSGACEGLQERLYFSRLTELIRLEPARKYDVEFKLASADGGSPLVVAKKAASITLDTHPRVAVFDYDGKADFSTALDFCRKSGVASAYSNYCFDLWLLLHKRDWHREVTHSREYTAAIRESYGLAEETDIKQEATIRLMVSQILLDDVWSAIKRANSIKGRNKSSRGASRTVQAIVYYDNPDLSVHTVVEDALIKAGLYTL